MSDRLREYQDALRTINVRIVADSRPFRRDLLKAQLAMTRGWKRLPLKLKLWRVNREMRRV